MNRPVPPSLGSRPPSGWRFKSLFFLVAVGPLMASPGGALRAYEKGQFPDARREYERLARERPDDPRLRFNAGTAAYRLKDWTNAATWFESVLASPDLDLQEQANYNLGNTRFRQGDSLTDPQQKMETWEQSVGHFEAATRLNPKDTNALANLAFARERLEELRRQQPPPPPKGGDKNKDKNKSQQPPQNSPGSGDESSKSGAKKPSDKDQPQPQQDSKSGDGSQNQPKPEMAKEDGKNSDSDPNSGQKEPDSKPNAKEGQASQQGDPDKNPTAANDPGKGQSSAQEKGEMTPEEAVKPGEMSPLQAQRLLDSQKNDEKALVFHARGSGKETRDNPRPSRRPW